MAVPRGVAACARWQLCPQLAVTAGDSGASSAVPSPHTCHPSPADSEGRLARASCRCRAPQGTQGTELLPRGPGRSGQSYLRGPGRSPGLAAPRARGKAALARAGSWDNPNARSKYLLQPAQVPRCLSACRSSLLSAAGQADACLLNFSMCPGFCPCKREVLESERGKQLIP